MKIIDYEKIRSNIIRLKEKNELMLVLKNDAYGFNMKKIVEIAKELEVYSFAVNDIAEAIDLRKMTNGNILLFGLNTKNIVDIKAYNLIPTANNLEEINFYSKEEINFAIEIDIGMNRFGIKGVSFDLLKNKYVSFIYIHFPDEKNIKELINKYDIVSAMYQKKIVYGGSVAIPYTKQCVRIGEAIYHNSLKLYGNIVNIKYVKKGEEVSYNRLYTMKNDGYIGVVDLGYYNGINTSYNGNVCINGFIYQVIGKICMNHLMILIDNNVKINDKVEIFGDSINFDYFLEHNQMNIYQAFLSIR